MKLAVFVITFVSVLAPLANAQRVPPPLGVVSTIASSTGTQTFTKRTISTSFILPINSEPGSTIMFTEYSTLSRTNTLYSTRTITSYYSSCRGIDLFQKREVVTTTELGPVETSTLRAVEVEKPLDVVDGEFLKKRNLFEGGRRIRSRDLPRLLKRGDRFVITKVITVVQVVEYASVDTTVFRNLDCA